MRDQDRTLMSLWLSWMLSWGLWDLERVCQILTVPSLLAEAKTSGSVGDHWRSSTLLVWPMKGLLSVMNLPLLSRVVRNILPSLSPVRRLPWDTRGDHAKA